MIRNLLYTLLIMGVFALLLLFGLHAPSYEKKVVQSTVDFLKWKPKFRQGPLQETEENIEQFNTSFKNIQALRDMTLARNEQTIKDLETTYRATHENLKQLLLRMDQQGVSHRAQLFEEFTHLHDQRRVLVESIIRDAQLAVNLNDQMEQEIKAITQWLNEQARSLSVPTTSEQSRVQQYENLRAGLKVFGEQSSPLDVERILFLKKGKESVDALAASNQELEDHFRALSSQIEIATADQSRDLWQQYDHLEKEQKELVRNMRVDQGFIGDNQQQVAAGISTISQNIIYNPDTQLKRFKENYAQLENQRTALLNNTKQQQQTFLDSRPSMEQLRENNQLRAEFVKEQAKHIAARYEQMEEYRRSMASTMRGMTDELRDDDQFLAQRMDTLLEGIKQKSMDRRVMTQNNIGGIDQRINDRLAKNLEQMQFLRNQMESAQNQLDDFIRDNGGQISGSEDIFSKLKSLEEKNRAILDNLKNQEERLRSTQDKQKQDLATLQQRIKDISQHNADLMRSAKERAEDQKRILDDRVRDQMQKIKDNEFNRKLK